MNRRTTLAALVLASSVACMEPADEEVGAASAALTPVTWTDVVGASAAGNDLTKTAPENTFNAGAVSVETLSGDGFVEFTTGEATTDKLAGLSSGNGGQGRADIDFAIQLGATGVASVWEGGVNRGGIATYAPGDLFRVQAEGGIVTYYRNGVLRYTSSLAPSFPLLVDTSLKTPGATIIDVAIESLVFWENVVGASAVGNDLSKTAPQTQWNSGATSVATIPSGDGYVQFTAADNTTLKAAGLSNGNGGESYTDIDFAFYMNARGGLAVYEAGIHRGNFGTYAAGDTFAVQILDGVVSYWKNGVQIHISSGSPVFPLVLDTALRSPGTAILDAKVVSGLVQECAPLAQELPSPGGFARPMSAAGDVLVVGHPHLDPGQGHHAAVYRRTPGGWTLEQTLDRNLAYSDHFGERVATDAQTIAVAGRYDQLGGYEGSVQVYRDDGAQWVDEGRLFGCPADDSSRFGLALAVRGDLLVAKASTRFWDSSPDRVYVFRRVASTWTLEAILSPPDWADRDDFGSQLAIGGDRIFIGASGKDTVGTDSGALYVYRFNPALPYPGPPNCSLIRPGKWQQEAVLFASNAQPGDLFPNAGIDVNDDGTRLIAGNQLRGTAHIFTPAGSWSEKALLTSDPLRSRFGRDVAFGGPDLGGGSVALVGANQGAAFVFADLGGWEQIDFLVAPDGAEPEYADDVDAIADQLFIGDTYADAGNTEVYVHDIEPACLGQ